MENYIIYEEIGTGSACTVYKGRRKGTINFVAVLSVKKSRRAAITNWVRIGHQMNHDNITQFYEWYETSNHLWLVVELCTGGSLAQIIRQDLTLPLSEVRKIGADLTKGIHALQKSEICIGDLCPSRCLFDGPGFLKVNNLSCAHYENEEIDSVYQSVLDELSSGIEMDSLEEADFSVPTRSIEHQSPESLIGNVTLKSDVWSLGVILFQMYTGNTPYQGNDLDDVLLAIKNRKLADIIAEMERDENCTSSEFDIFIDLIQSCLTIDQTKRMDIDSVMAHPFWKGKIKEKVPTENKKPILQDSLMVKNSILEPDHLKSSFSGRMSIDSNRTLTNSVLMDGELKETMEFKKSTESVDVEEEDHTLVIKPTAGGDGCVKSVKDTSAKNVYPRQTKSATASSMSNELLKRQKTKVLQSVNSRQSARQRSTDSIFAKSGLPQQSMSVMTDIEDDPVFENVPKKRTYSTAAPAEVADEDYEYTPANQLLLHNSENPDVGVFLGKNRKDNLTKYETRNLPHFLIDKDVNNIDDDAEWKILFSQIQQHLTDQNNKVQIAILGWITYNVCKSSQFSKEIWNTNAFVTFCARQIKSSNEHRGRFSKILSTSALTGEKKIDFHNAQIEKNFREVLIHMCDALREQFSRSGKQKLQILPSLGHLLILAARYDEKDEEPPSENRPKSSSLAKIEQSSSVLCPPPCFSLVIRCLGLNEEYQVQLFAANIIQLHAYISPRSRFAQSGVEAGWNLWKVATNTNVEGLRIAALSALAQISNVSPNQAVTIFDKVGLPAVLDLLNYISSKTQSLLLCLIGIVLAPNIRSSSSSRAAATRVCQHRDTLQKVIRLSDSNSPLCRSKAFLVLYFILSLQPELLLSACKNKIVASVEREAKRKLSSYAMRCHAILTEIISQHIPDVVFSAVDLIGEASSRKHPTQPQLKVMKEKLPELQVLPHLISSNIFRHKLINIEFLEGISTLAKYGCEQRLATAMGDTLWQSFLDSIISVLEVVCARPELLSTYSNVIIINTFPLLTHLLVSDKNSGSKLLYIKLINDLLEILIDKREHGDEDIKITLPEEKKLALVDEIPSLLLNEPPLPVFSLRLFYQLIMYDYEEFSELVPKSGIIEVLITFVEMQTTEQSNVMLQKQLYPLLSLLWEKGQLDCIFLLLENDFTALFVSYLKTSPTVESEMKEMIFVLVNKIVSAVSDNVKVALKAKNKNAPLQVIDDADKKANYLLRFCKPITETISFIFKYIDMNNDEEELLNCACSTISLVIHLWGGDGCRDLFSKKNLSIINNILNMVSKRNQRLLLKSIRKGIQIHTYTDLLRCNSELVSKIENISKTTITRSVTGDSKDLQSLAMEIIEKLH